MQVLVTGATSFIGGHVTEALSSVDFDVTATYRSANAALDRVRKLAPKAKFVQLNLANEHEYSSLPNGLDAIVHIAGISSGPWGTTIDEMLTCNVTGTRNLLKYAEMTSVSRVVFTSTLSVYGEVEDAVVTETTSTRAPDPYGASKLLAERLFAEEGSRMSCVALRLPGVLGAGAHRAWLPTLLSQIKRSEEISVYSAKSMFNNAVHVHDLSDLIAKLLKSDWSGFHAFPLGAAGQMSVGDLVDRLISLTGSRSVVKQGPERKRSFMVSSDYASKNFGYNPMNIEMMVQRYVRESR